MSADNKPIYTLVGLTVMAGVAAIVAALVCLGGFDGASSRLLVETYYDHPVSGLSPGSAVNFRGVKVGEVKSIKLAGPRAGDITTAEAQRVRILLSLDLRKIGVPVKPPDETCRRVVDDFVSRGLRATVSSSGITGLSRVELNFIEPPPPVAQVSWQARHPLIPPAPSLMEDVVATVTKILNRFEKTDFVSVWSNLASMAASARRLTENADALVESQRAGVGSVVRNMDDVSIQLRELVRELKNDPSRLLRPVDAAPLPETAVE